MILVPVCASLTVIVASLQFRFVLKIEFALPIFIVPALVGSIFGFLLGRVLDLRRQVGDLNAELAGLLRQKESALAQTREQLAQAQKMTTLGQLAAGVAHDFNNILTAIMSGAALAQLRTSDSESRELLNHVISSGESAAVLTQQLLAFGRPIVEEPESIVAVDAVIEKAMTMLKLVVTDQHQLKWTAGCQLAKVDIHPAQVEQVLMNLIVNARDAMPEGGEIAIGSTIGHDDKVEVTVRDHGTGIREEVLRNVTDPFFTTKTLGQGTGLGLAVIVNILAASDGSLDIQSQEGKGTTVTITWPQAPAEQFSRDAV